MKALEEKLAALLARSEALEGELEVVRREMGAVRAELRVRQAAAANQPAEPVTPVGTFSVVRRKRDEEVEPARLPTAREAPQKSEADDMAGRLAQELRAFKQRKRPARGM